MASSCHAAAKYKVAAINILTVKKFIETLLILYSYFVFRFGVDMKDMDLAINTEPGKNGEKKIKVKVIKKEK